MQLQYISISAIILLVAANAITTVQAKVNVYSCLGIMHTKRQKFS